MTEVFDALRLYENLQSEFDLFFTEEETPLADHLATHVYPSEVLVERYACSYAADVLTIEGGFAASFDLQFGSDSDMEHDMGATSSASASGRFIARLDEDGAFTFEIEGFSINR